MVDTSQKHMVAGRGCRSLLCFALRQLIIQEGSREGYRCPCGLPVAYAYSSTLGEKSQRCPVEATTAAYIHTTNQSSNQLISMQRLYAVCLLVFEMIITSVNYMIISSLMMCEPRVVECIMASLADSGRARMRVVSMNPSACMHSVCVKASQYETALHVYAHHMRVRPRMNLLALYISILYLHYIICVGRPGGQLVDQQVMSGSLLQLMFNFIRLYMQLESPFNIHTLIKSIKASQLDLCFCHQQIRKQNCHFFQGKLPVWLVRILWVKAKCMVSTAYTYKRTFEVQTSGLLAVNFSAYATCC